MYVSENQLGCSSFLNALTVSILQHLRPSWNHFSLFLHSNCFCPAFNQTFMSDLSIKLLLKLRNFIKLPSTQNRSFSFHEFLVWSFIQLVDSIIYIPSLFIQCRFSRVFIKTVRKGFSTSTEISVGSDWYFWCLFSRKIASTERNFYNRNFSLLLLILFSINVVSFLHLF